MRDDGHGGNLLTEAQFFDGSAARRIPATQTPFWHLLRPSTSIPLAFGELICRNLVVCVSCCLGRSLRTHGRTSSRAYPFSPTSYYRADLGRLSELLECTSSAIGMLSMLLLAVTLREVFSLRLRWCQMQRRWARWGSKCGISLGGQPETVLGGRTALSD